jgi:hypothetical protein
MMVSESKRGKNIPPVRTMYRMWLLGARSALTTIANGPDTPGDDYLESMLERPAMYVGPSVQALEIALLNLLNFRAVIFGIDHDPRVLLRKTYLAKFGKSAGAGGAAPSLIAQYGDDPAHPEIGAFYKAFVEAACR